MAEWKVERHCQGGHWHSDPGEEFLLDEGGHCLQEGDEVLLKISSESREAGYNPYPDNTRATVVGFIEEGPSESMRRVNRAWLRLMLADGSEIRELAMRATPIDREEHNRRCRLWYETAMKEWYAT
ncbi:hypothetical protein A3D68_00935 [Candidatus Adlerbacteria bacterium RIFCSPHIGHO2_02_FULL_52_17]|uniref:Uncharacterized protein n=1 Tax=Candidatus Adlerbacteria bacterium RIFCSPHIGHO2_02_FULL_52_17 TaxID=1797240 RepID=A0A1F4XP40_9BACT|nr:MAG: hypothetical protein A3D68_00935 [Candidatus Adlerbacteria bacterium RIFCSPHIGHO2_02_FULL_52_17]